MTTPNTLHDLLKAVAPFTKGRIDLRLMGDGTPYCATLRYGEGTYEVFVLDVLDVRDTAKNEALIVAFVQAECQRRDGWDMEIILHHERNPACIIYRPATPSECADESLTLIVGAGLVEMRPFEASAPSLAHAALTALRDAGQDTETR